MSIYLDYNASTPIDPAVLDTMIDVYRNHIGNADSRTHDYGESARQLVEGARRNVADMLGRSPSEVFFTSGATESNNISIQGLQEYAEKTGKTHLITTAIEHKSVLETVKEMGKRGFDVDIVSPDASGRVSTEKILSHVRKETLLVSIMHVNNETGVIQPVDEIGEALAGTDVFFHVDATQSCGKLVGELRSLKYDMLSFSAHKLRGPQGIGCLILHKKRYKLPPIKCVYYGGQQEHGIRPGTLPVALIAGCGKACELALNNNEKNHQKTRKIKQSLLQALEQSDIEYHLNGDPLYTIDNTMNIYFPGVASEALMLEAKQYCGISNGSACTSHSYAPSYVLSAMGLPEERIRCSVRVSWGPDTDICKSRESFCQLINVARSMIN